MIRDIRNQATELTKSIDSFVNDVSQKIEKEEKKLSEKMKEYALIDEKEKKVVELQERVKKERLLIEKEKEASRTRQKQLDIKENKLQENIKKVNELLEM